LDWLNLPHSPTLPPPVTAKRRLVKFQDISLDQGIDGYVGKDYEKRRVLRWGWKIRLIYRESAVQANESGYILTSWRSEGDNA